MTDSKKIIKMELIALTHRQLEMEFKTYEYENRKQLTEWARELPRHAKRWIINEVQVVALDKGLQEFLENIILIEGWNDLMATCNDLFHILKGD